MESIFVISEVSVTKCLFTELEKKERRSQNTVVLGERERMMIMMTHWKFFLCFLKKKKKELFRLGENDQMRSPVNDPVKFLIATSLFLIHFNHIIIFHLQLSKTENISQV